MRAWGPTSCVLLTLSRPLTSDGAADPSSEMGDSLCSPPDVAHQQEAGGVWVTTNLEMLQLQDQLVQPAPLVFNLSLPFPLLL